MNPLNYCTLELSRKLVENGIDIETEAWWYKDDTNEWILVRQTSGDRIVSKNQIVPAPSFAELWWELPEMLWIGGKVFYLTLEKTDGYTHVGYDKHYNNTNPADALAELLIWVEGREK